MKTAHAEAMACFRFCGGMGKIVETPGVLHNCLFVDNRNSKMHNHFDWALEQGSLIGAARQLKSSQPTIGRHVAEQESQLGVLLFERTGRGLLPTAMALQLAGAARAMEAGAHQLSLSVSGANSAVVGTVRITASQPASR